MENNSLGGAAAGSGLGLWLGEIPDCDTECKAQLAGDIAQGNAKVSAHLAGTIGLAMLPGGAQVAAGIGSGANAAIQYAVDGEVSYTDALIAGWVGGLTATSGFGVTVGVNAVGGAASNAIKGDDPLTGAITSGLGAVGGYGIGKGAILGSNAIGKYATKGWNPKFDPNHLKYREVKGLMGISKEMSPSKIPGVAGNVGSSAATEIGTKILEKRVEKLKTQNDE
ncbi:hypothetical protein GTU79_01955 [Sodalis ligni]|uniref:hypothetical protein n=1 Tax=Sodalis ligni TaxID=2697027 RepID=UPI001BDF6475|nr:hypothetical protein [Sodalis ligni]QWA11608.1 hypothetical protein GTU79_01955 [Sodalis ligni]